MTLYAIKNLKIRIDSKTEKKSIEYPKRIMEHCKNDIVMFSRF